MKFEFVTKEEVRQILREELNAAGVDPVSTKKRFYLDEAAEYVKMPVPSFRMHQHKIKGVKIGKRWTFSKAELDKFIEANTR